MLLPKRKQCSKCGKKLPATTEFFHKAKTGKWGLKSKCKECRNKEKKQYIKNNKDKIAEYHKEYYKNNKDKIAEYNKEYYKNNKEYYKEYRENNKEYYKEYYEDNKDKIAEYNKEYHKEYYEDNKDKIAEYHKEYYKNNKDKIAEYNKEYYKNNPEKLFNNHNRRRQLEEQQGNGISKEQWLEMFKFFDFKCAYSGITLSKDTRTVDHIIPLVQGGLNEIWNCVPMYKNHNSSKSTNNILEWYSQQEYFSLERLFKIYEWIEYAYNKWGNIINK